MRSLIPRLTPILGVVVLSNACMHLNSKRAYRTQTAADETAAAPVESKTERNDGENVPNPDQVQIRSITYGGSGCPDSSVSSNISPDARAITVLFDSFAAEVGPSAPPLSGHRNCQVNLDLQVPNGYSYTLVKLDTRGFANLQAGVNAEVKSTVYFQSAANSEVFAKPLSGELQEDYTFSIFPTFTDEVWSPCGEARSLNINTEITVNNSADPTKSGSMTVDSLDGELTHLYGIKWQLCPTEPTPTVVPTPEPTIVVTLPPPPPTPLDPDANLVLNTSIALLSVYHPDCSGPYNRSLDISCRAAVRRLCADYGYPGGMLVEYDSRVNAQVVCLRGELRTPALSTLTGIHPSCKGLYGPEFILACDSAATALCGAAYAAAFLQEYNGPANSSAVICVSPKSAQTVNPSIQTLNQFHPYCQGPWNLDYSPITCNAAYSRYCRSLGQGFNSGFISNYDSVNASGGACVK